MTREELIARYNAFKRRRKYMPRNSPLSEMTAEEFAGMLLYVDGPDPKAALAALNRDFVFLIGPKRLRVSELLEKLL